MPSTGPRSGVTGKARRDDILRALSLCTPGYKVCTLWCGRAFVEFQYDQVPSTLKEQQARLVEWALALQAAGFSLRTPAVRRGGLSYLEVQSD